MPSTTYCKRPEKEKQQNIPSNSSKPNILLICTDDVGIWNVGAYTHAMMVPTPNIDRIVKEGMLFTDHYAAPTCTPGRAMFITGQLTIKTGFDYRYKPRAVPDC